MATQTSRTPGPTRDRLIETARRLFLEQGYTATGLAQILREADVNSGSLYHFFKSKEDLLVAVLERYRDSIGPWLLDPIVEQHPDPLERIFALLDVYRRGLVASEHRSGCPIGNLALELNEFHPAAYALVQENFEGWRSAVRGWLDEAAGRFGPEADPAALATFVLTTMEGAVMLSRAYRDIHPFDTAVARLRDYLERLQVASATTKGRRP